MLAISSQLLLLALEVYVLDSLNPLPTELGQTTWSKLLQLSVRRDRRSDEVPFRLSWKRVAEYSRRAGRAQALLLRPLKAASIYDNCNAWVTDATDAQAEG